MTFQAKVLYDFQSVGEGELSIRVGDIVTITNPDVGEGWWFGTGVDGMEGVVPEAYVERVEASAPPGVEMRRTSNVTQISSTTSWGDEWDSDEEHRYEDPKDLLQAPVTISGVKTSQDAGSRQGSRPSSIVAEPVYAAFSLGKFSSVFGKSGAVGDYLIGLTESSATLAKEAVLINEPSRGYFQWENLNDAFSCAIGAPKKSTKFGGMKSFIAYQVTPSLSNIQVSRRYKHFDWLYERLSGKFGTIIAIPPLPEKQVTGRFEEDLIEHRRIELQSFVDRICRHPVLANSEVWRHFLTQTDDKKWTQGKRKAESDTLVGISFLTTIQAPSILSETETAIDENIGQFSKDIVKMDSALKNMNTVANDQIIKYRTVFKKDCQDIGKAFSQLGSAVGENAPCLNSIGACYEEMSSSWDEQVTKDWEPVQHLMHDYKGLVGGWQGILGLYGSMSEKQREIMKAEGNEKEKDCAVARVNTYRIGVQAEQNFFKQELGVDMTHTSQVFLAEQINFHRKMADKLEKLYHDCWPNLSPPENAPADAAAPTTVADNTEGVLNQWESEGIYEEV
eukprot:GFUD01023219.1.p1 GENE.GFUD01023219.1~~GFUD01023219.1.p1  ORF type:complete len:563 (-),score=160.59 GFUD01023219.1:67-1755(-)